MFEQAKKKRAFSKALLERLRLNYSEIKYVNNGKFTYGSKELKFKRYTFGNYLLAPFMEGEPAMGIICIVSAPIWLPIVIPVFACIGYRWTVNGQRMTVSDSMQVTSILRKVRRADKAAKLEQKRQEAIKEMNKALSDVGFNITEANRIK